MRGQGGGEVDVRILVERAWAVLCRPLDLGRRVERLVARGLPRLAIAVSVEGHGDRGMAEADRQHGPCLPECGEHRLTSVVDSFEVGGDEAGAGEGAGAFARSDRDLGDWVAVMSEGVQVCGGVGEGGVGAVVEVSGRHGSNEQHTERSPPYRVRSVDET